MEASRVLESVQRLAADFAKDRRAREQRRELAPAEFAALKDAGFLLTGVPIETGGLWANPGESTRPICEILRALARGDSSVALVSSMHCAVTGFWLATPAAHAPHTQAWAEQRRWVSETSLPGGWWGTTTSEP